MTAHVSLSLLPCRPFDSLSVQLSACRSCSRFADCPDFSRPLTACKLNRPFCCMASSAEPEKTFAEKLQHEMSDLLKLALTASEEV